MAAKRSSISTLWHQHYGHYLSQLVQADLVIGLSEIQTQNLGICRACQTRKQHRTLFLDCDSWRASKVLQLVHADIYGPMATPITGSMCFLLFVDDFNRKMWVYFLHKKLEVFVLFQKVQSLSRKRVWSTYCYS